MNISAPQRRYLVINGDDFGLSAQVNAGIIHAHTHGILTNTSLMVTAPAWQDAVARAKDTPSLSVGLHLTLVQGKATLPPHCTSAITDFGGNFPDNPTHAGLRYFFSRRARHQVRDECRAQIEKLLAIGLPLGHVDGHLNIHMHPTVMDILIPLLLEYHIPAMRVSHEPLALSLALDPRAGIRKRWESLIFTQLARRAKKKLHAAGIVFPSTLFGLHQSGEITESYLLRLIPQLAPGVTELYCHPAFLPCLEVQRWTPTYRRDVELDALTRRSIRNALEERGITLISYRELPRILCPSEEQRRGEQQPSNGERDGSGSEGQ
jgi:hopanoid biosynthesis associated protein HpnK